jgi:hypothetical protein
MDRFYKAPKLRFKVGTFVRHKKSGCVYEVEAAFRIAETPNQWEYHLGLRNDLVSRIPAEDRASRVIYKPFPNSYAAMSAFLWKTDGDEWVSSATLMNHYAVVSLHEVLPPLPKEEAIGIAMDVPDAEFEEIRFRR